ncbi:MAG TPA: MerR family transcriptional regulator [Acidimicrobiales bacterium]|nr:MerR family transcriptional regulator [Acidimicrobiales bacterium]
MSVIVGKMRIGEVHTLLRHDYPDIELSKIRYYEDKGLVQPSRSRKGYRLYSERDVECLREAIRLAQEEFVPLRVVRLRLIEQGLLDDVPTAPVAKQVAREAQSNTVSAAAPPVAPRTPLSVVPARGDESTADVNERFFSTTDFLSSTGLEAHDVNQMVSLGLLVPVSDGGATAFTGFDVRVGLVATSLLARGADLRFLGSLRRVVERELGVVEDLTLALREPGSRLSDEEIRAVTAEVVSEVAVLRSILHERAVRDFLGG